jgi:G3E family GTPase
MVLHEILERRLYKMVKVDIISGFLGAGKTTLIQKLLKTVYKNQNVVLIENEFGEIGIDGGFLKEAGIEIKEMNSGCICCSLVGDFSASLKEVVETYQPERIIIEPSGVGKLSDVMRAVDGVKNEVDIEIGYRITVLDVNKCKMYLKNFGEFYVNQIEYASTIVFSRTDIAKEGKVEDALAIVKEHNKDAAIVTTPVEQLGEDSLLAALNHTTSLEEMLKKAEEEHEREHHHHDDDEHEHHHHHHDEDEDEDDEHEHHHHHHDEDDEHVHYHEDGSVCHCHDHDHEHHHHHADDVFTSWGTETSSAFTKAKLQEIFDKFEQEDKGTILRSKGIVKDAESDQWIYFDYVPGQCDIRQGAPDYTGKVVVIAAGYTEEELKDIFFA